NFGYCVLGRIIEKVSGKSYESYVRESILKPMGITRMRIGKGREKDRFDNEATYYAARGRRRRSEFSEDGNSMVPAAYGFASPDTMDAHGGWIASVVDLARFATAIDESKTKRILSSESLSSMFGEPPAPLGHGIVGSKDGYWYGCGWNVRHYA